MKKLFFPILAVALLMTTGCKTTITITAETELVAIYVAGSGTITIDWGDGLEVEERLLFEYNDTDWNDKEESEYEYSRYYPAGVSSRTITISGKNITHLDCSGNLLTELNISKNTTLTYLNCFWNQLTSLDVSKNSKLTFLHCGFNQLTNLDLTKNIELEYLACQGNRLTSLDLSKNVKIIQKTRISKNNVSKKEDFVFI